MGARRSLRGRALPGLPGAGAPRLQPRTEAAGRGRAGPGRAERRGVPLEAARNPCGSPPAQEERRPCPARREDAENGGCRRRGAARRPRRGLRAGARGRAGAAWGLLPPGLGCAPAAPEGAVRGTEEPRGAEPPAQPLHLVLPRPRGRAWSAGSRRGGAASPP